MEKEILEVRNLKKYFPIKIGFLKALLVKEAPVVHAVDDVSFKIKKKEIFGLVGESGCGKTTTGRAILRLTEPTAGKVFFIGKEVTALPDREMQKLRRKMQIIFQDPYESLNPRMSVYDLIAEPMQIQNVANSEEEIEERIYKVMEEMELVPPEEYINRFPHELSGGQRQRVAITRAFTLQPEFIVAVMYLGQIVEKGSTEDVIRNPFHPYTRALVAAVPVPDPTARRINVIIGGQVPSPINPPSGCRFHTRCYKAQEICKRETPQLIELETGRYVACHFPEGK